MSEMNVRSNDMKIQTRFKSMKKMIQFFFILFAVLVLTSCSSGKQVDESSCYINMGMRVTIDVTAAKPRVVFDQLARELDCAISVSPFVRQHVTLQVENATVSEVLAGVCSQIGCKYISNENHLAIKPITIIDKMRAKQWEEFNRMMEERNRILQSRLPDGMSFEDVPLSTVLNEISKASGLKIKPWQDEGDRKVTIDVSAMTVNGAIKAVVLYVDGEGAVLIRQKYFLHHSWGQYWPWGYPPKVNR
jgi:hypothetical protein